jgi:hypothetical protein
MLDELLPKSTVEHKIACTRQWWVEHAFKEREENLCHVHFLDLAIGEGIRKQSTLVYNTNKLVRVIIYKKKMFEIVAIILLDSKDIGGH